MSESTPNQSNSINFKEDFLNKEDYLKEADYFKPDPFIIDVGNIGRNSA